MKINRQTLAENTETAFTFDEFYGKSVVVKNMTAGNIQFCDGLFNAGNAAIIPPYGWQSFNVTIPYGETPKFYVKAAVAGDVEIDFGSDGMGGMDAYAVFNAAGMIPHTLNFSAGDDTTLTAELIRLHGETLDLAEAVALTTGATVYSGDVIKFTAACSAQNYDAQLTVNGVVLELTEGVAYYTNTGNTTAEADKVLTEYTLTLTQGANTTLTAVLKRERGAEEDLEEPVALATGVKLHAGDITTLTAVATEEGQHATLTINETPTALTEDKADHTIAGNTVAVSAAVSD
jgi:hypothetical protein